MNLAEGITLSSNDGITGTRQTSTKTSVDVKVPAKLGDYTFTLTNDSKVKNVTVHVIDATMPASYTFEKWREDDIGSMTSGSDIKVNTTHVKGESKTTFTDTKTEVNGDITFYGNVNTMKGNTETGKFYRVRIKLDDKTDINAVKAVSKDGTREYTVTPVSNAEHTIFVDLDAEEAITELVIANKNASKEQIEKETTSCHTVTFESTSKIWLRDARASGQNNTINNTSVTMAEVNKKDNHTVDVGVKFDKLEKVKITDNKDTASTDDNGDYWVPVVLKLNETTIDIQKSVYIDESSDIVLNDTLTVGEGKEILIWVKSNKTQEQEINFTLHYNRAGETNREDLPVTVILHDASAPKIVSVAPGDDDNAKALQNLKVENSNSKTTNRIRTDKVTVDTYKYGMKETTRVNYAGKEEKGRWYSIKLTFNVPVSSILFNNSGNQGAAADEENWLPLSGVDGNQVTIWINRDAMDNAADKSTKSVEQTLCNKWAIEKDGESYKEDGQSNDAKWTVGVTVEETEKSKTALADEISGSGITCPIWTAEVRNDKDLSTLGLTGISVKENLYEGSGPKTLRDNLIASQKLITAAGSENKDSKTGKYTATLTLNTNEFAYLKLDNTEGKWALIHVAVRGNIDTIKSAVEDKDTYYVDAANASKLVTMNGGSGDGAFMRLPIWVNLTSERVLKATGKTASESVTPLEIKFTSATPVEEENSFFLKVVDNNPNTEEVEASEPVAVESNKYENDDTNHTELHKDFGWGADSGNRDEAFLANMKVMESADINITDAVDNTVYVSVKADLEKLQSSTDFGTTTRIPLTFDVNSLGTEAGDDLIEARIIPNSQSNTVVKDDSAKQTGENTHTVKINFKEDRQESELKAGKVTVELFLIAKTGDDGSISDEASLYTYLNTHKYIRYVVTFEQN